MSVMSNKVFEIIIERHVRFFVGLFAALVVFFFNRNAISFVRLGILSWTVFVLIYISFSWFIIFFSHPKNFMQQATEEDVTGSFIFLLVLGASICSLAGIFLLLKANSKVHTESFNLQILLSFASVFSSWILVHTLFTFRYAHLYYSANDGMNVSTKIHEGLKFPGEKNPDYLDFAYFSFILGMTFQVSDVQITSRKIRRFALLHGSLSFIFNTIILALSINIVSGIISNK